MKKLAIALMLGAAAVTASAQVKLHCADSLPSIGRKAL